ncbi:hypothetical protein [Paenibacillus sp. SI8]
MLYGAEWELRNVDALWSGMGAAERRCLMEAEWERRNVDALWQLNGSSGN